MDLELDVRTSGRPGSPITVGLGRELTSEDLPLLALARPSSQPNLIKRLSDRHHALARTLASGASERDAAIICGYDLSRVSILKNDPTFQELLAFHREKTSEAFVGMAEKLSSISSDALTLMAERLEDEPEKVPMSQLLEIVKLGADRTGYGPQSQSTNLNINVNTANRLEEARKRVAERRMKQDD